MRRVGLILTKLLIAVDLKAWTFGQFAWIIVLLAIAHIYEGIFLEMFLM